MRPRTLILPVLADAGAALAFAVAWPLRWGTCAPPSPDCATSVCLTVCVNPWYQLPMVAGFGALLGVLPAVIVGTGLLYRERMANGERGRVELALVFVAALAVAIAEFAVYLG